MSGRGRASRGRGLRRQTPAQQGTPATPAASTATTASMAFVGTTTGLRRSQRIQNQLQAQQQATPATAATPTTATTSKGKQPKKAVGKGKAPATTTTAPATKPTAPVATPSTSGTPATPGLGKRKRSEEMSPTDGGLSTPLAHTVRVDHKAFVQSSPICGARKVCELCKNFPSLIPPDAAALPEELAVLKGMGFHFVNVKPLGGGVYGTIYECKFIGPGKDGKEMSKILACKRVAINQRLDQTIQEAENKIQWEILISELLIENPHLNVTKHELIYKIRSSKTDLPYQNPINQLILMEKCEGSLKDFVIRNFGYSTTNDYKGQVPEIVNKIWMYHVCHGLDFLHDHDKKNKQGNSAWYAIIHHDLKHDNILYQIRGDRVKFMICDFGLSQLITFQSTAGRDINLWSSRSSGSARFMSPESRRIRNAFEQWKVNRIGVFKTSIQYEARKKDVYALGMMLSDCLVGFADPSVTVNPPQPKFDSAYAVANEWLVPLRKHQSAEYFGSPRINQQKKVSYECITFMFECVDLIEINRPLASQLLTNKWLKDVQLTHNFVDFKEAMNRAAKQLKANP